MTNEETSDPGYSRFIWWRLICMCSTLWGFKRWPMAWHILSTAWKPHFHSLCWESCSHWYWGWLNGTLECILPHFSVLDVRLTGSQKGRQGSLFHKELGIWKKCKLELKNIQQHPAWSLTHPPPASQPPYILRLQAHTIIPSYLTYNGFWAISLKTKLGE